MVVAHLGMDGVRMTMGPGESGRPGGEENSWGDDSPALTSEARWMYKPSRILRLKLFS